MESVTGKMEGQISNKYNEMMVYIYVSYCNFHHYGKKVDEYMRFLPETFIAKMNAFKFKEDSYRYLLGKILLLRGLSTMGYAGLTLSHLRFNEYNKPYFDSDLDFNISHSGDFVLCALSTKCSIGVDLEKIENNDFSDYHQCFTKKEWSFINNSNNPLMTFYQFWTKKEAIIKADGRGLYMPLQSFDVTNNEVTGESKHWYITELAIMDGYVAHLATSVKINGKYSIQRLIV